ncbi:uncharacterized protein RJT21DRAFT_28703 [Scheffersomyces amazonensis]|uniref:uncharacterized protein n=1 Tax=Scheffersomyces amazonensis TaxID=1078765 RepID=UPI00315D5C1E
MSEPSVTYITQYLSGIITSGEYVQVLASILVALVVIYKVQQWINGESSESSKSSTKSTGKKVGLYDVDPSKPLEIKPVDSDFVWDKQPALKSYPFKNAAYKLTMAIKTLDPQDWLLIEPTYLSRLEVKSKIIHNKHEDYPADKDLRSSTVFVTDEAIPAIRETYNTIVNYMVVKYPMYFQKDGGIIHNLITKKDIPATSTGIEPVKCLEYLTETIEEDIIILLTDPTKQNEENGTEYFFKAGVFAFAAGFDPRDRFNRPLTAVHERIPGYEEKMKVSMNRFFQRISPGQFVTRSNFSVQTHNKFYVDDANKGHNLPEDYVQQPIDIKDLDFDTQVHYRSERQVLTRLPETGAVLFTIRTYLTPLSEFKQDGKEVCERLIGAINGFPDDIRRYKAAGEWGPPVIQYLETSD